MNGSTRSARWGVRIPLLVATAVAVVVALAVVYLVVAQVGGHNELVSQKSENRAVARVLVAQAEGGITTRTILAIRHLLDDEHMHATIAEGGTVLRVGPEPPAGGQLARVRLPIRGGGAVSVVSAVDSLPDPPFLVVLLATGALVLVLGVAVVTNVILTRQTRRRVALAVGAAERISAGDLSARIGERGPEPLRSLGHAFDEMASRLEAADSAQRALLADLAHEIATPVHALSGYAKAVLDGAISRPAATAAIDSQTERLSRLLDELAELRVLDDERPARTEQVDLRQLVQQVLHDLAPMATHARLRLHLSPVAATTDPELFKTVVRNLLSNAFHFTPSGGTVGVSARRVGRRAVVSVRDSGPGIAPEHHAHLFDRFYRAEAARDRARGGTGLGLAIARRASDRIGGRIELVSAPGKGSEFRLIIPLVRGGGVARTESGGRAEGSGGRAEAGRPPTASPTS